MIFSFRMGTRQETYIHSLNNPKKISQSLTPPTSFSKMSKDVKRVCGTLSYQEDEHDDDLLQPIALCVLQNLQVELRLFRYQFQFIVDVFQAVVELEVGAEAVPDLVLAAQAEFESNN